MKTVYYTWNQFDNYGYISTTLTDLEISPIKNEISKKEDLKKYNYNLAGNIAEEYELIECKEYCSELLTPYAFALNERFPTLSEKVKIFDPETQYDVYLSSLWVNFQKKYEFNPPHTHQGVFSFVLWIDIPYKKQEEIQRLKREGIKDTENFSGDFYFLYINSLGQIKHKNILCDETQNNKLIIFPADMTHGVHPFYTSDKYRVTVSGNFFVKTIN